ncbi:MAG: glycosyltransferase family 2 protein [Elusimicrobia bacterium]|nr:glycosyltransferase family 2 protein [Elusimicrobiota bacterium]
MPGKLSVIIPVYNEENTVREILEKVLAVKIDKEVIVVDDGSTDSTAGILRGIAHPDLKVFIKDKNQGKASAVRCGIGMAGGDYILIQDADMEYDPGDYGKLMEPLIKGEAGAVYGDRFPMGAKNMFFKQWLANRVLTVLTNLLFASGIKDMETCYKVIPLGLVRSLNLEEERFDIEAEVSAKLLKRKIKIANVPIRYKGRSYKEGKKIGFGDALSAVRILLKYRFFRNF